MTAVQVENVAVEPDVQFPDLEKPVIVTRPLCVVRTEDGKKKATYNFLKEVRVEVLVNERLYVVCEDTGSLRRGNVLSRRMDLTVKEFGTIGAGIAASHCFMVFDGVNHARRGLGRIDERYKKVESPELSEWQKQLNWMMRKAWTLHRDTETGVNEYRVVGGALQLRHGSVRNAKKVDALKKTAKATSLKDSLGRRNSGMAPLLTMNAEDKLAARAEDIRGIGRHMTWRESVLENYIDQLRVKCLEIQGAVEHRLVSDTVFGSKGTPVNLRLSADRMVAYADLLLTLNARPFTRALAHASEDLQTAAMHMKLAANIPKTERLYDVNVEYAKEFLRRVYRSMRLLEYHWRLEEVLVIVAEAFHRKATVGSDQLDKCIEEVGEVHRLLKLDDEFTKEPLDKGFKWKNLPQVQTYLEIAFLAIEQQDADPKNFIHATTAYEYLKAACYPI